MIIINGMPVQAGITINGQPVGASPDQPIDLGAGLIRDDEIFFEYFITPPPESLFDIVGPTLTITAQAA